MDTHELHLKPLRKMLHGALGRLVMRFADSLNGSELLIFWSRHPQLNVMKTIA
jgi:hypothetical protein